MELRTDPARAHLDGLTGIYVRALDQAGRWRNADVLTLTDESLRVFLESRESVAWAVGTAERLAACLRDVCTLYGIRAG